MQKKRVPRTLQKTIPAFHTFLIQQYIEICEKIKISLLFGSAQIYGVQLKYMYPHFYTVPCSIPVYTWQGAQIRIQWTQYQNTKNSSSNWIDITQQNKVNQSPMMKYFQIHYNLTTLRRFAFDQLKLGPKVAIVGTDQSAAQNVTKLLLNYTGKLNMNPIFVDLDPQSTFFVDGTIGAVDFQYKITQDLFDRPNKIAFYYGNRSIKSKSYLEQVTILAHAVKQKLRKQMNDYKLHGTKQQFPVFTTGLIIQCPKIKQKQDKKQHIFKIKQILRLFQCTHLINIGCKQIQAISNNIQHIKCPQLQGTQSFLSLPRPIKSKIQRHLMSQSIQVKYPINQIKLYELMTQKYSVNQPTKIQQNSYCRAVSIRQQAISKNVVAVLTATLNSQNPINAQILYKKAISASVLCLARISSIEEDHITFEVGQQHFFEALNHHIWVTSVSDQ